VRPSKEYILDELGQMLGKTAVTANDNDQFTQAFAYAIFLLSVGSYMVRNHPARA
jgi:hypothetical protein